MSFFRKLVGGKSVRDKSPHASTETTEEQGAQSAMNDEDSSYAKFLADWTLALKSEDQAKLSALLKTQVPCNFCGATSEAADAYVKGGNFVCPKCGKAWFAKKR